MFTIMLVSLMTFVDETADCQEIDGIGRPTAKQSRVTLLTPGITPID